MTEEYCDCHNKCDECGKKKKRTYTFINTL